MYVLDNGYLYNSIFGLYKNKRFVENLNLNIANLKLVSQSQNYYINIFSDVNFE